MMYSEKQHKELVEKLKKLEKENNLKEKENKLLNTQNKLKDEVIHDLDKFNYRGQCDTLKLENEELKKKVMILEEKLGIARISLEKNSSNSCKPSSTNNLKKVIQNNRVKSGRKPGRLAGHEKSSPNATEHPDRIIPVKEVKTCTCGCSTTIVEDVKRDLVSIQVIVTNTQYVGKKRFCPNCDKFHSPKFPKGINQPVQYDSNLKTILSYLNVDCNVANVKIAEFLQFVTDGKIRIAPSTVTATLLQFKSKAKGTLKGIKEALMKEAVIYEDESPISVNGKIMSSIGCFTKRVSYLDSFANRKLESFKEMGILDRYIGTVCHDHNTIHKGFIQFKDAECNFHILRYCKAEYEIHKREVIKEFMDYLLALRDKAQEYSVKGDTRIPEMEYEEIKKEYLKILDKWDKEYHNEIKTLEQQQVKKYHEKERCLKQRLRKDIDDHLRFLTDFRIEFTNNLAERGLRPAKTKLKVIGSFRNLKYAKCYFSMLSIIQTGRKQGKNIGEVLKCIFEGKKVILA